MMKALLVTVLALCLVHNISCGWSALNLTHTAMMGLTAVDGNIFIGGMTAGAQQFVLKSSDGGNTFNPLTLHTDALMTFTATFASATSGISTGLAIYPSPDTFTTDGQTMWATNQTVFMEATQSSQVVYGVNGGFGSTGQYMGNFMGVAISTNGGRSYTRYNAGGQTQARYGAFPSATTWYVAYGTWGNNSAESTDHYHLTQRVKVPIKSAKAGQFKRSSKKEFKSPAPSGYWAQIMRTTDGGKTFESVFLNETFYFNDIRCVNEKVCFVTGENDQWAVVYATWDGGNTWEQVVFDSNGGQGASLMGASFTSETDWWACGGGFVPNSVNGHAWHSTDQGKTWSLTVCPGAYFFTCSMVSANKGYATAGTAGGAMQLFGYSA